MNRLTARLEVETATVGETLDDGIHTGLQSIMTDSEAEIYKRYPPPPPPPDSFGRIFWDQQKTSAQSTTPSAMRWHPLMIKWCFYLRHLSSSSYEALRKSGCFSLPSERTLRDYTHYAKAEAGFSTAVDEQLIKASEVVTSPSWKKYVVVLMDEMHIREDLYNKFSGESFTCFNNCFTCTQYMYVYACTLVPVGALVGFTELGNMNTHLANFEEYLQKGAVPSAKPMAKSMLVLMVRGLNSGLQFPYAQFPCATLRGDQMFHILWKAVGRLQRYGFWVMGLTCDGLAANRQLFRLHAPKKNKELVYKTSNPYSVESHCVFFLSDPPHLLKTIRNCFANKNSFG